MMEISSFLPKEVLAWSDIPLILIIIALAQILRPWFDPEMGTYFKFQETFRGDRILLLPLLLGLIIAIAVEFGTEVFNLNMAIRRTLTTGCGAAVGFRLAKIYFPSLFTAENKPQSKKVDGATE